jgi:hypothetical protein
MNKLVGFRRGADARKASPCETFLVGFAVVGSIFSQV